MGGLGFEISMGSNTWCDLLVATSGDTPAVLLNAREVRQVAFLGRGVRHAARWLARWQRWRHNVVHRLVAAVVVVVVVDSLHRIVVVVGCMIIVG